MKRMCGMGGMEVVVMVVVMVVMVVVVVLKVVLVVITLHSCTFVAIRALSLFVAIRAFLGGFLAKKRWDGAQKHFKGPGWVV